jgi:hypothetical protein
MKYGRYGWSHLFLSWGLGIVFLWIGVDILRHPTDWIGYIPPSLTFGVAPELFLKLNGIFDIVIGAGIALRFWPKLAALLAVFHLLGILVTSRIDAVLIRDVGLLGAALALLAWPTHYKKPWFKFFRRKRSYEEEE